MQKTSITLIPLKYYQQTEIKSFLLNYFSLTRALMAQDHTAPVLSSEAITDGIDISTWAVKHGANTVQYSVWDFAGQTVYYNTHQVTVFKDI